MKTPTEAPFRYAGTHIKIPQIKSHKRTFLPKYGVTHK